MNTTENHTAARADVLSARTTSQSHYVSTDTGALYAVLGNLPGETDRAYAVSERTGTVVLVTRTGQRYVRGYQLRVRVDFPRDTGDVAGTLAFDAGHVGGVAPAEVFGR